MSKDKVVRVRMSEKLLGKIDNAAEQEERSRSGWIRKALKNNFKGDDNMKIVDVVELNRNGVEVEKEESPVADRWFDDNGALPDGNFDENEIAGEWLVIDGKLDVNENVTYAYRTIDNITLVRYEDLEFDFDEKLANKYELNNSYTSIAVDVEKYEDYFEIGAGFFRRDGGCAEIFLEEDDLFYLLEK